MIQADKKTGTGQTSTNAASQSAAAAKGSKRTLWQRLRSPALALMTEGIMAVSGLGIGAMVQGCENTPVTIESIKSDYRKLNDLPISMRANAPELKFAVFGRDTFECENIIQGAIYDEPDFVAMHAHPAGEFITSSIGIRNGDTAFFHKQNGPSYKVQCLDIRITNDTDRVADFDFYIKE